MTRRIAALAALVAMVVAPPLLLLALGSYDWRAVNLWTTADVRLLLLVLTAVGWLAWGLWVVSLLVELVSLASRGRVRLRLPGLAWGQSLAASLLAAIMVTAPAVAVGSALVPATAHAAPAAPTAPVATSAPDTPPLGAATTGGVTEAGAPAAPRRAETTHAVAGGDDLWSLAQRYYADGTRWRAIVEANPALATDPMAELEVGAALRIVEPVHLVTVRAGDTLWGLAERHLGDAERWPEIHQLNRARISDPDVIRAGWVLKVPMLPGAVTTEGLSSVPGPPTPGASTGSAPEAQVPVAGDPAAETPVAGPAAAVEGPLVDRPGAADVVDDTPEAAPIAALVGGLSAVTAGAVLGGLAVRRRLQEAARPLGRRYIQPGDDLRRIETALAIRSAPVPDLPERVLDREDLVARAMRHLSAHWLANGAAVPALERAVMGDVDAEFVFVDEQPDAPAGFQHRGRRIAASWNLLVELDDPPHPVAYPALVTLGEADNRDLHMVDLLADGVLALDGVAGVDEALSAMVVELACAPWASELGLLVVTGDPDFARAVAADNVVCTPDVAEGVARLEQLAEARRRFLSSPDAYDRTRLDPDLAEAWAPQVVVFESVPGATSVARITAATAGRCGLAAVLPAPATAGLPTWQLDGSDAPRGTLVGAHPAAAPAASTGELLTAQTLPRTARDAIASLYDLARATTSEPAPWWATPDDPEESDVNIVPLRPAPAAAVGPLVRLLGPVELEGATGEVPPRAARQCIEYCAWLLDHPGATATQMAAELLVAESTRRSNMSRLRTWLGADADGNLFLPDAYSGRIHLHPDVTSDWDRYRQLLLGGVNRATTERLVAALDLVRGAPLADAAPGQWHWAEELRSDMVALVRDTGVVLAQRAREERNLDLARWAANRALAAAPDDELLLCERVRIEYAAGQLDEVDRLANRIRHTARTLGIDLLPDTVDLLQEVMEGRLRARRA